MKKIFFILFLSLMACSSHKKEAAEKVYTNTASMKSISYDSFSSLWEKVHAYEKKALTKSALDFVKNTIYPTAKKENNTPQIVKSLLYISKYNQRVNEEALPETVKLFKDEIEDSEPPLKNILQNYLAQIYWKYYQQNRHKFASNVSSDYFDKTGDFRTWDMLNLFREINRLFEASLKEKELLRNLPITNYQDIVSMDSKSVKYFPSLYDLLLNEALKFYKSEENSLPQPSYKFSINKPEYLSSAERFINLKINSLDSLSLLYKSLKLYQDWIKIHSNNKKEIDAKAIADLQRLNFVYQHGRFAQKDSLYLRSLHDFVDRYKTSDIAALALYHIANFYYQQGLKYNPEINDKHRFELLKAEEYCDKALELYPKSEGASKCRRLKNNIHSKIVEVKLESLFPENQEQLVKIRFKNVKNIKLSVFKVGYEEYWNYINHHSAKEELHRFIKSNTLVYAKKLKLPETKDYQTHSVEKVLKGLPNGSYILLIENLENSSVFGHSFMQSTDVALQKLFRGKKYSFNVVNRKKGRKLTQYKLSIKKKNRPYDYTPTRNYKIQKDGSFVITPSKKYEMLLINVKYGDNKEAWFTDNIGPAYDQPDYKFQDEKAFIFTDRSIYRPGQVVYYKVLALKQKDNHSDLLPGKDLEIILRDANYKEVGRQKIVTNDFGTAAGSFILPQNLLTGNFSLQINSKHIFSSKNIKVENYKRPKFEVKFLPVEKAYKVNEQVQVQGEAVTYSGAFLTDAKLTYRVKRIVELPRWWFWYRPVFNGNAQEIAHGVVKIDEQGKFKIDFKALPDLSLSPKDQPVFTYEILAEVTDVNGETHMATTKVKAGYQSIQAHISAPSIIVKENRKDSIKVKITNLNGVKVPADATINIYKLKAPSRVLRERPWGVPDIQELDKDRFVALFPHIPYNKEESDYHFWPQEKKYFTAHIRTGTNDRIQFPQAKNWPLGKYLLIVSTLDKEGQKVEDKLFFDLISFKENKVPDNVYFEIYQSKKQYQPGDFMQFKINSAVKDSYARIILEKKHKIIYDKWVHLDNTSKTFKVYIDNTDRGGFVVHYVFNAFNTWRKGYLMAQVPYPSKDLKIETLHFRDKLKPGSNETFTFKLRGPKGEKVAAEMLASMYDASLDAFVPHTWNFNPIRWKYYSPRYNVSLTSSFRKNNVFLSFPWIENDFPFATIQLPRLNWFGFRLYNRYRRYSAVLAAPGRVEAAVEKKMIEPTEAEMQDHRNDKGGFDDTLSESKEREDASVKEAPVEKSSSILRKNLKETAFFYPQLRTDSKGNISFSFKVPDALTKWKLQILAHDKKLNHVYKELITQTQKDLMIFPNMPRFVREGDEVVASVKISNLTNKKLSGNIEVFLQRALNEENVSNWVLGNTTRSFEVNPKGNTEVSWRIKVKDAYDALQYKFIAKAGDQADGEQNILPVLTNRVLVTETMPMWVRGKQEKTYMMGKLMSPHSKTLKNHSLSLEVTSNPAWYAIQALPYLIETTHENSEQVFSRFYANSIAEHIINKYPEIKKVFDHWKNSDALLSALEKNAELKAVVLEATPWVRQAESETEQKKRIALLFDYNKMAYELQHAMNKLQEMQMPSGGFVWYKGAPRANRYITQYIVNGYGHLKHLGINVSDSQQMMSKAVHFSDNEILKDYEELLKEAALSRNKEKYLKNYSPGFQILYYLYGRSFYPEIPKSKQLKVVYDYYLQQAQKFWVKYDYYSQALIALSSNRNNNQLLAKEIIRGLDENSVDSKELGKYWKTSQRAWRGYRSDIENQALMIEAFQEIGADSRKIDEMRIWLLKHKQTNAWRNSKQTAEAIYAFLNSGTNWLPISNNVKVKIGEKWINPSKMPDIKVEAGSGYFKKSWTKDEIHPEMGKVKLVNSGKGIVWGALYWQYFEDINKVTQAQSQISVSKDLFIRKFTDRGEEIIPITNQEIKIGDLVRVRLIIKVDRDMEFVHLKDLRASGLEPVDVLSGYKWKKGLGYYLSIDDVSANFFFSRVPKGVYVFEYDLRANNAGTFSDGMANLQSMYAPEFSAHSKGRTIKIVK